MADVELIGMDTVLAQLQAMHTKLAAQMTAEVKACVEQGKDLAMSLAPVKTGLLRSRMQVRQVSGGGSDTVMFELYNDTPYAIFQEMGTKHMRAHPFLTPAMHFTQSQLKARLSSIHLG